MHDIDPDAAARSSRAASQLERAAADDRPPERRRGASPSAATRPDGQLARRGTPGAVITDVDEAARRAVRMAVEGMVEAIDGTPGHVRPRTLCIHGDNPHAARIAAAVRAALEAAGVELAAF